MSSNELERIYNQVRIVDDPYSTSQICANLFENNLFGFRVYCSLEISCLKNYSVYNNDELKITLIVIFENRLTRWLSMSKSTITGAGFGVFAEKPFRKNEFITVYLGKKVDYTYMHGNVVGLPSGYEFKGIHEEYWLGHRINHGSGRKANVRIKSNLIIIALRDIEIGEELLVDYNRDVFCVKCNKEKHFGDIPRAAQVSIYCINCGIFENSYKDCPKCQGRICQKCYDEAQVNIL